MADSGHVEEPKNFAPKTPVNLAPPKDDPITPEELSKCDGSSRPPPMSSTEREREREREREIEREGARHESENPLTLRSFPPGSDPSKPTLVAIKGTVFDVSGNDAYAPKGQYHGQSFIRPSSSTPHITTPKTPTPPKQPHHTF
jgi:hypothetical protein